MSTQDEGFWMCRGCQMLGGVCGRDGLLQVHRWNKLNNHNGSGSSSGDNDNGEMSSQVLDIKDEVVWRCKRNVTGTVLASSGDGGVMGLWKSNFSGKWKCVSQS